MYNTNRKIESRIQTLIRPYQVFSGNRSIPEGEQMWSLSADCRSPNSELLHLEREGFLTKEQYHGVDRDAETIKANRKAFPEAHWYNDEFYDSLLLADNFNPALVNFDSLNFVKEGFRQANRIIRFLSDLEKSNIMLSVNTILASYRRPTIIKNDEILDIWSDYPAFRYALESGIWMQRPAMYQYGGNSDSAIRHLMGTFTFWKGR